MEIAEAGPFVGGELKVNPSISLCPDDARRSVACPHCYELILFNSRSAGPMEACDFCGGQVLLHPERADMVEEGVRIALSTSTVEDLLKLERMRDPIEYRRNRKRTGK